MYLLTGVSGMLGLALADKLTKQGDRLVGVSLQNKVDMDGLRWVRCDLTDPDALPALIRQERPRFIIHSAAATNVDWCEKNPELACAINTQACRGLVTAANAVGAKIVYISTDSVFDGTKGSYVEDDTPNPLNVYARSKLEAEKIISSGADKWLILRTNIFGWNGQNKTSLAEWILQEVRAGREITGFDDVIFSPLLTSDLSDVMLKTIKLGLHGLHHAGSTDSCSKLAFAQKLIHRYQLDGNLIRAGKVAGRKMIAARPLNTSLSSARLEGNLGYKLPSLEEALERFQAEEETGWAKNLKKYVL